MLSQSRAVLRRVVVVVAFAVAMGYLEAACVAYLQRAIGMTPQQLFPVRDPASLDGFAAIEVGREAATLVMLGAIGLLLGEDALERLAWTSVAFGVWDIAYYGGLIAFLGWPGSLGTWDLLFLIPAPWTGPVWAPLLVSIALICFGVTVPWCRAKGRVARLSTGQWFALLAGGLLVLVAFLWNASLVLDAGVPKRFPWVVFVAGMAIGVGAALRGLRNRMVGCSRPCVPVSSRRDRVAGCCARGGKGRNR